MKSEKLKRILVHLRFPFSFFLLPIFLFAASTALPFDNSPWWLFFILHLMIYPSSNGYNSLMDRDTESIGGIEFPEEVPKEMFAVSLILDVLGLGLTWVLYGTFTALLLGLYVVASRAYSYRGIRLKKHPIVGYMTVVIVQGGLTYLMVVTALTGDLNINADILMGAIASALMIGASYPLTQVYQHKQDAADGVTTISSMLGIKGTFTFSFILFFAFNTAMFCYLFMTYAGWPIAFGLLLLITAPAASFLLQWHKRVRLDASAANYHNSMVMSKRGSIGMNVFFFLLLLFEIIQFGPWN